MLWKVKFVFFIFIITVVSCSKSKYTLTIDEIFTHSNSDVKWHDMVMKGNNILIAGGNRYYYGALAMSIDSGQHFMEYTSPIDKAIFDIEWINANEIYLGCLDGKLLYSNDTANSFNLYQWYWQTIYNIDVKNTQLNACGGSGNAFGVHWYSNNINSHLVTDTSIKHELRSVEFIDSAHGFMAGYGYFAQTIDGGLQWQIIDNVRNDFFIDIYFINSQIGFVAGFEGSIYKTNNGGKTWIKTRKGNDVLSAREHINKLHFYNDIYGMAFCTNGNLLYTKDGGDTWYKINIGSSDHLRCGIMLNNYTAIVGSENGKVYRIEISTLL